MTAVEPPATTRAAAPRLAWMDQVRGAAMLLVILYHGDTILRRFVDDVPSAIETGLAFFGPFRMPLLMFLSGMLLERSLAKPTAVYFGGKLRGIAWPYVLWSFVFLAVSARLSSKAPLAVLLLPPTYLWYLWFLLAYYVGAWISRRLRIPLAVPMALAFIASFGPDVFRFSRFCFLFVFFGAGSLYAAHQPAVDGALTRGWVVIACAGLAVAGGLANARGVPVQYSPLYVLCPIAGIVVALHVARRSGDEGAGRVFAYVGRDSIVFYVTHFTVMWIVATTAPRVGFVAPVAVYVTCVAAAVGVGLALTWARHRVVVVDAVFQLPKRPRALAT